jgi:uncharacterized membrane protein YhhN
MLVWAATAACALQVAVLLAAERRGDQRARAIAKLAAAAAFLAIALAGGALQTRYGMWVTAGLVFGALGDAALLGHGARIFALGMGLFAAGHGCYLAAVAQRVMPSEWAGWWAALPIAMAAAVLSWLWRHLGIFRVPVIVYMTLFATFVTAAWSPLLTGAVGHTSAVLLAVGATLFYFSDVAVARQRFVVKSFWNKSWGLPFYFGGQVLIAWSAITL